MYIALSLVSLIELTTSPSEARVYIDGEYAGTTPLLLNLSVGMHNLRVELKGYETVERSIEVSGGEKLRLDLVLAVVVLVVVAVLLVRLREAGSLEEVLRKLLEG